MGRKKSAEANLKHWFGEQVPDTDICNMPTVDLARVQPINWALILQVLAQQSSFVQLRKYINANPIPDLICQPDDKLRPEETINLDLVVMYYMPTDMPSGLAPMQIEGDWNCFPCTISYLLSKSQAMYIEIRVHIIYEAVQNIEKYPDDICISIGATNFYEHGTLPEQYAQYSDNYNSHAAFNMVRLYKEEVLNICKDGAFMGIWQIFQIANVVKRPIVQFILT